MVARPLRTHLVNPPRVGNPPCRAAVVHDLTPPGTTNGGIPTAVHACVAGLLLTQRIGTPTPTNQSHRTSQTRTRFRCLATLIWDRGRVGQYHRENRGATSRRTTAIAAASSHGEKTGGVPSLNTSENWTSSYFSSTDSPTACGSTFMSLRQTTD